MRSGRAARSAGRRVSAVTVVGVALVGAIAVVYPLIASRTQSPLALFAIPVLVTAALGTIAQTAVVGVVATTVATVEGILDGDLDGVELAARLTIIVASALIGIVVAEERTRRQRQLEESTERSVLIDAFQSSLAPVPAPPAGVRVDVRFRFGDERFQLGGDFLDAIELPDGTLGYIIGDVCGHGVRSAALGSAIRTGWKTIAIHQPDDPVVWADTLERAFFRLGRREGYVTVNMGRFDHRTGTVDYVSAGHPWPILAGERTSMAQPDVCPPLGIARDLGHRVSRLVVPEGATLLLYTDGLYEHPGQHAGAIDGEAALLEYVGGQAGRLDLDALLDHFGARGFDDDVALMTIRADPTSPGHAR